MSLVRTRKLKICGTIGFILAFILQGIVTAFRLENFHGPMSVYTQSHGLLNFFVLSTARILIAAAIPNNQFIVILSAVLNLIAVALSVVSILFNVLVIFALEVREIWPLVYLALSTALILILMGLSLGAFNEIASWIVRESDSLPNLQTSKILRKFSLLLAITAFCHMAVNAVDKILVQIKPHGLDSGLIEKAFAYSMEEPVQIIISLFAAYFLNRTYKQGSKFNAHLSTILIGIQFLLLTSHLFSCYHHIFFELQIASNMFRHRNIVLVCFNFVLSLLQVTLNTFTCIVILNVFCDAKIHWDSSALVWFDKLKNLIICCGTITFVSACAMFGLTCASFFSVAYATSGYFFERHLPFYLLSLTIMCFIAKKYQQLLPYLIPGLLACLALVTCSCLHNIFSFISMTYSRLLYESYCSFDISEIACPGAFKVKDISIFFIETIISLILTILAIYWMTSWIHMCSCLKLTPYVETDMVRSKKKSCKKGMRIMAYCEAALIIIILVPSSFGGISQYPSELHQLWAQQVAIRQFATHLLLLLLVVLQLSLVDGAHVYPMKAMAISAIGGTALIFTVLFYSDYFHIFTNSCFALLLLQIGIVCESGVLLNIDKEDNVEMVEIPLIR